MFRRLYKSIQVALCLSLLFLSSCASPTVLVRDAVTSQDTSYAVVHDSNNYKAIKIAQAAIDEQLDRSEVLIRLIDVKNSILIEHHWLLVKSITGNTYLFHDLGAIQISSYYLDENGQINIPLFAQNCYIGQKFYDYTIKPLEKSKTKSDSAIVNGCLIQAINFQANLKSEYGSKLAWHSILHVYYTEGGVDNGHAYCVFGLKDGTFYADDSTGTRQLRLPRYDAFTVGDRLKNNVTGAYYDSEK